MRTTNLAQAEGLPALEWATVETQLADLLLHDAQYFEDEYAERIGWGHSSVSDAVAFAQAVGARRLVLFHHEPRHTDGLLESLEARARSLAGRNEDWSALAREGMVVELP